MNSREDGQRRIRTATVGLAAASLLGTAALAVTVAVQASAEATADSPDSGTTDSGTTDQGGTGFTPPDGGLTNGGSGTSGSTAPAACGQQRSPARHRDHRHPPARPLRRLAMTRPGSSGLAGGPGTAEWSLWSVTARIVVTRPQTLADARDRASAFLAEVERAGSRFRPDSELMLAQLAAATGVAVSPLLADLVGAGLDAARRTDGAVDPTVGGLLHDLGYDRDIRDLPPADRTGRRRGPDGPGDSEPRPGPRVVTHRRPDWRTVRLDRTATGARLTMPAGTRLDLGATAKAYAADRCAAIINEELDTGVLVCLGGDIATAGPAPDGGWRVLVQDRPEDPAQTVGLPAGAALATSSTVSRRWRHQGIAVHHIVDPRTGTPAPTRWRSASVAAATCLQANAASTAALVHGDGAPAWLRRTGLPARLVGADGRVHTYGGWPRDGAGS